MLFTSPKYPLSKSEFGRLGRFGRLGGRKKSEPNFQVLDKVPFFKNKEVHVIPMENPDLNPFAVEEVYEAPSKTVSYKTM